MFSIGSFWPVNDWFVSKLYDSYLYSFINSNVSNIKYQINNDVKRNKEKQSNREERTEEMLATKKKKGNRRNINLYIYPYD